MSFYKSIYQTMTWCEGNDLAEELAKLSLDDQYAVGIKAGEILRRLHEIYAPDETGDWYVKYNTGESWERCPRE